MSIWAVVLVWGVTFVFVTAVFLGAWRSMHSQNERLKRELQYAKWLESLWKMLYEHTIEELERVSGLKVEAKNTEPLSRSVSEMARAEEEAGGPVSGPEPLSDYNLLSDHKVYSRRKLEEEREYYKAKFESLSEYVDTVGRDGTGCAGDPDESMEVTGGSSSLEKRKSTEDTEP